MHSYIYLTFSRKHAYDQIRLGSTSREVQEIFDEGHILCGDWIAPGRTASNVMASRCYFADPWRLYLINIDVQRGRVASKSMKVIGPLAQPNSILLRLIAR
ncbi:MAG: hypothetical protein LAQ69_51105, partial [Acidobacteriia bacterium]|nr:hypothetical protein [Terriglobia bacterium]